MKQFNTNYEARDRDPSQWARYGMTWSAAEKEKLYGLFASGRFLEDMCMVLGRPASGVISKLQSANLIQYNPADDQYYINETNAESSAQPVHQSKEKDMSTNIAITNKTLIGGVDASQLTDEQIFQLIARKENEIKTWETIQARPKKLQAIIDEAKADIQKLVDFVDAR
jgi:hypothetical protein